MNIKKFYKDVRGAALVYVIVAAAIITLLGAATIATAYVNLRATQIQEKSDNNFYNADSIMNAIVGGLEQDISFVYEAAYTEIVTTVDSYDNDEEAAKAFERLFKEKMMEKLNYDPESPVPTYSVNKLQEYVQGIFVGDVKYTITALNGGNFLDETENGIILRNLHITYEDDSGYFDEITTDIKIAPPPFTQPQDPPPKLDYLVIDDGLQIESDKGLIINGDAYINEREQGAEGKEEETKNAILLKDKSYLAIISPTEIIAGGRIKTLDNTELIFKNKEGIKTGTKVWTEDFDFGRYTYADLSGIFHVYDDLEINGSHSDVKVSGEYFGYSSSGEYADESSSININGANTRLDIKELDALILAGSSYISTSTVNPDNDDFKNDNDLQLGEALSVKSNQIAYLVDETEFTSRDVSGFVSNPMSYTQYYAMCDLNRDNTVSTEEWETIANAIVNHKLSYGKTYQQFGASVMPVFSGKDNGTVYFYLNFRNADDAAEYFVAAYEGDSLLSQRLRTYAAQYITKLQLGEGTKLLVNSNYISTSLFLYTKENLPNLENGFGYGQSTENHNPTKPEIQNTMNDLVANYKLQYLGDGTVNGNGEKYKVMYEKIINSDQLTTFITGATTAAGEQAFGIDNKTEVQIDTIDGFNGVIMTGANGSKVVLVDNKDGGIYKLGSGSGLAIISGDCEITGNWIGTIIVGGRAYCTDGTVRAQLDITVDEAIVHSVLPMYFVQKTGDTETAMSVLNIFKGYELVEANRATMDEGINNDQVSNCISFTNWNRD